MKESSKELQTKIKELQKPKSKQEMIEKRKKRPKNIPPASKNKSGNTEKKEIVFKNAEKNEKSIVFNNVEFEKKRKAPVSLSTLQQELEKQKKVKVVSEDDKYKKLIKQASGEKVLDNVKLLKKTIDRKNYEKKKSAGEWNDRKKQLELSMKKKQEKRDANIKERKELKKQKSKKGFSKSRK